MCSEPPARDPTSKRSATPAADQHSPERLRLRRLPGAHATAEKRDRDADRAAEQDGACTAETQAPWHYGPAVC